jgi:hypothetical protein
VYALLDALGDAAGLLERPAEVHCDDDLERDFALWSNTSVLAAVSGDTAEATAGLADAADDFRHKRIDHITLQHRFGEIFYIVANNTNYTPCQAKEMGARKWHPVMTRLRELGKADGLPDGPADSTVRCHAVTGERMLTAHAEAWVTVVVGACVVAGVVTGGLWLR